MGPAEGRRDVWHLFTASELAESRRQCPLNRYELDFPITSCDWVRVRRVKSEFNGIGVVTSGAHTGLIERVAKNER